MTIGSFGKASVAVIVLTAAGFLTAYVFGVPASAALMTPWSAVAFLIVGVTLWSASSPSVQSAAPHRVGALLVFSIGAIITYEHLVHAGFTAFDRLLFLNLLPTDDLFPGRPAQLAGFRF